MPLASNVGFVSFSIALPIVSRRPWEKPCGTAATSAFKAVPRPPNLFKREGWRLQKPGEASLERCYQDPGPKTTDEVVRGGPWSFVGQRPSSFWHARAPENRFFSRAQVEPTWSHLRKGVRPAGAKVHDDSFNTIFKHQVLTCLIVSHLRDVLGCLG